MSNRTLYAVVFFSGMTVLAVELGAARLLGAYFGTSNLVWATIIGLILIYLAVGYYFGGKLADRYPRPAAMFTLLAWGAFTAGLIPMASRLVLPAAAQAFDQLELGMLAAVFAGVLVLFSIPMTLLGMISPFAIRLAIHRSHEAGSVSGKIYAVSTMGSFIGSFLPDLLLISLIGTTLTFLTFSLVLTIISLIGLWSSGSKRIALRLVWMPIVLIVLAIIASARPMKNTPGQIFETESSYNYIEVVQSGEFTMLRLNEGQGIHSIYHPTQINFGGTWEQLLVAPFFYPGVTPADVQRMAVIGLAAGTVARQATAVFGAVPIDGYEIDPKIVEVGQKYFDMNQPNLNVYAVDGRWGLNASKEKYTLIAMDAYRPPYIPWHLTTYEYFVIVKSRLTYQGAIAINVGRAPDDRALIGGLVSTLKLLFPSIYVIDIPDTFNSIIYATATTTQIDDLEENLELFQGLGTIHPLLLQAMATALDNQQPLPPDSPIFTDDLSPIELITNRMVLSFILAGGTEDLH